MPGSCRFLDIGLERDLILRWNDGAKMVSRIGESRPAMVLSGPFARTENRAEMFGSIGGPELLFIFVIALLIFGPRKLSELGRTLGKGVAEFRKAATDLRDTLDAEVSRTETGSTRDRALMSPRDERSQDTTSDAETRDHRT